MNTSQTAIRSGRSDFAPFWVAAFVAFASVVFTLLFANDTKQLRLESGAVEIASAFLWFFAAASFLWLTSLHGLSQRWHVPTLFLLFGARELDFDKRFLSEGILKARLYSGDSPIFEKLIGLAVIALILVVAIRLIRRNWRDVLSGLRGGVAWCWATFAALGMAVVSKSIDGAGRKLAPLGIELSPSLDVGLAVTEEIMELAFAVVAILAVCLYERLNSAEKPA